MLKIFIQFVIVFNCANTLSSIQRKFPDDFTFGVATSAYQIEGGWNSDDKSENIWDHLTHTKPYMVKDLSNGDTTCDSYHNYKRDVQMIRELGINTYRFSLSWSRILPFGLTNKVSKSGVMFYNNYINELIKYNITPIVTLYHWDLPQYLQNMGGFANPLIDEWFEGYARVAFSLFGDRIKRWITFNEPNEICQDGYGTDKRAPAINSTGIAIYLCAKHLLIAHAKAYHAYNNFFKPRQGGECGITIHIDGYEAMTDSREDEFAAEIRKQAEWGMYTDPILSKDGGYPKELLERVATKSNEQGFRRSRMIDFTAEEKVLIKGTCDFLGLNHYSGKLVSATRYLQEAPVPSLLDDIGGGVHIPDEWPKSASEWLTRAPNSHYKVLVHLNKKYNNTPILITESGWSTPPGDNLDDNTRIEYYRRALEDVLDALEAGVKVKAFIAWSLMDNLEWMSGYTERFGLYHVNFEDSARTRTPRKSAFVYKEIVKTKTVDWDYEPRTRVMSIDEGH